MSDTPSKKAGKRKKSGGSSSQTPPSAKRDTKKQKEAMDIEDNMYMLEQSVDNLRKQLDSVLNAGSDEDGDSISIQVAKLAQSIEFLTVTVNEVKEELRQTNKGMNEIKMLREEIASVKTYNQMLNDRLVAQEDYSRRDNVIVTGLKEVRDEDCRAVTAKLLKEVFDMDNVDIVRVHRLG